MQFIQPRVNTRDVTAERLDDVLGGWWTVAAWGNDPARLFSEHDRTVLEKMGAQLVALTSETQRDWAEKELAAPGTLVVGDTNGDLKRWFDVHGVGVVFLRPDRFVAAACLAQQAPKALHAVIAAMSSTAEGPTS